MQAKPEEVGRQTSFRAGAIATMPILPRLSSGGVSSLTLPSSPGTAPQSLTSFPFPSSPAAARKDGVVAVHNPLAALAKVAPQCAYVLDPLKNVMFFVTSACARMPGVASQAFERMYMIAH